MGGQCLKRSVKDYNSINFEILTKVEYALSKELKLLDLNCPICWDTFNESTKEPLVYNCGHSICQKCYNKFKKTSCPLCKEYSSQPSKNFLILNIISKIKEKVIDKITLSHQNECNHDFSISTEKECSLCNVFDEAFECEFCPFVVCSDCMKEETLNGKKPSQIKRKLPCYKCLGEDKTLNCPFCKVNICKKCYFTGSQEKDESLSGKLFAHSLDNYISIASYKKQSTIPKTLSGHSAEILVIIGLPLGKLASGSNDRSIKLWSLANSTCLNTLIGHESGVTCLAKVSAEELISGSLDKKIKLWNYNTAKCLKTINILEGTVNCLLRVKESSFLHASNDGSIVLWETKQLSYTSLFNEHKEGVTCLLRVNLNNFISGSIDKTIKVWSLKSKSCVKSIDDAHSERINAIVNLDKRECLIASTSNDKEIKVWNIRYFICIKKFKTDYFDGLVQLNNKYLASYSKSNLIVEILNVQEETKEWLNNESNITCFAEISESLRITK